MKPYLKIFICVILAQAINAVPTSAHDSWLETNSSFVTLGDNVYIDLKLGNHGNDHRDFKLAGKVTLDSTQVSIIEPGGNAVDLKPKMVDLGLTTKEGYLTAKYATKKAGLHIVALSSDGLRGKTRSVKSAKAYFLVGSRRHEANSQKNDFDKPLGQELKIVPLSNPATNMGPNQAIRVKVLLRSQPFANARVSFIPQGTTLSEGFDSTYERMTNPEGVAEFTPTEGNLLLIVVHHAEQNRKVDAYDDSKYSATLTLRVPQITASELEPLPSN